MTVLLGALGALLVRLHGLEVAALNVLPAGWGVPIWMASALAAVPLIYRSGRNPMTVRARILLMAASGVVALAGVLLASLGFPAESEGSSPLLCLLAAIIPSALAIVTALGTRRLPLPTLPAQPGKKSDGAVRHAIRGVMIALSAPMLLYAAQPLQPAGSGVGVRRCTRAAFILFLIVLALGSPVVQTGYDFLPLVYRLRVHVVPFAVFSWVGCALLLLCSRWPVQPRYAEPGKAGRAAWTGTLVVLVMALAPAVAPGHRSQAVGCVLLLFFALLAGPYPAAGLIPLLTPWPAVPRLPKLGPPPRQVRLGPWFIAAFLGIAVVPVAAYCSPAIRYIVSGELFAARFSPEWLGSQALDETNPTSMFFRFAAVSLETFGFVLVARWLGRGETRGDVLALALPSLVIGLCLLAYLTVPVAVTLKYLGAMGFTVRRLSGVVYGLAGYAMVLGFLAWLLLSRQAQV